MDGPRHFGIGVASAGLVLWGASAAGASVGLATAATGAALAGLGALAPDIDHPHAMIGNRIPFAALTVGAMLLIVPPAIKAAAASGGMYAGVWSAVLQSTGTWSRWGGPLVVAGVALLCVSVAVTRTVTHRGPTHSLLAVAGATFLAVVTCVAFGLGPFYGLLLGLGGLTHLMADATTSEGVPALFWPFLEFNRPANSKAFGLLVIPVVLLGLAGWSSVGQAVLHSLSPAASTSNSAPAAATLESDVPRALLRLEEADSSIAAAITNPDTPVVARDGAYTSYTWEYLRQTAPNQVAVKKITITLDTSGQMVGASK